MCKARFVVLLAGITLLGLLAGCANTAAKRTESGLDLKLASNDGEGFVILKVISVRPISLLNPKWQSISISRDGERDEMYDITPKYNMLMGKHVPTESLYFAKLAAGEYQITGLTSVGPGPGLLLALMMGDRGGITENISSFTVRAGRLANLGTLVYVPPIENERPEHAYLLGGPVGKKAALDTLLFEAAQNDIPLKEEGGWVKSVPPQDEPGVLANARRDVSMLDIKESDGQLVAGSHLGLFFRRNGPQNWAREAIDTLGFIHSVVRMRDGRLVAGSDYGEYYVKENAGWARKRLASETGRIAHIEPRPDGSMLFVAGDLRKTRLWLTKSVDDAATPAKIAEFDSPPDHMLSAGRELVFAWNVTGITRECVVTRIHRDTLAVTSQNEKFWVRDWQRLPNGDVALTRQNAMTLYWSIWKDNGSKWEHTETIAPVSTYWHDPLHGVSLDATPGFSMVTNQLRITDDGGRSWTRIGNPIETRNYAGRIVYADAGEILVQGSNMLYSTVDSGRTWTRIFPTVEAMQAARN